MCFVVCRDSPNVVLLRTRFRPRVVCHYYDADMRKLSARHSELLLPLVSLAEAERLEVAMTMEFPLPSDAAYLQLEFPFAITGAKRIPSGKSP